MCIFLSYVGMAVLKQYISYTFLRKEILVNPIRANMMTMIMNVQISINKARLEKPNNNFIKETNAF